MNRFLAGVLCATLGVGVLAGGYLGIAALHHKHQETIAKLKEVPGKWQDIIQATSDNVSFSRLVKENHDRLPRITRFQAHCINSQFMDNVYGDLIPFIQD